VQLWWSESRFALREASVVVEGQKWSESNQSVPLGQASIGPAERRFITRLPAEQSQK
jgi:hypothetical protein